MSARKNLSIPANPVGPTSSVLSDHASRGRRTSRALVALAGLAIATLLSGCQKADGPKDRALAICTEVIRGQARNPSSAEIPAPTDHKVSESGQALIWAHGDGLRFMNGFGAKLDTSAKCFTTPSGLAVTQLYMEDRLIYNTEGEISTR